MLSEKQRKYIVLVLLLSGFVTMLNQNLLNTALPNIMKVFKVNENTVQWLATVFLLVNGVMIPITAALIEKYSTRKLFFSAMSIFILGTLLAVVSSNFTILLIARVVQALGAGVMMPLMQTTLFLIFPLNRRGYAMGLAGLVIGFAPAIGPSLSGYLVDKFNWYTPFELVVITSLIILLLAYFKLENISEAKERHIDKISIITSTIGFGGILYAVSTAGEYGWLSQHTLWSIVISLLSISYFVYRQSQMTYPVLNFAVFQSSIFILSSFIGMLSMMSLLGVALLLPLYVQGVLHYTAIQSGLLLLPGAIIIATLSLVNGKIFDKYGAKWLSILGFVIMIISTLALSYIQLNTSFYYLLVVYTFRMIGISMVNTPSITVGLNALPKHLMIHGNAMMGTLRTLAASVGSALLVSVMTIFKQNYLLDAGFLTENSIEIPENIIRQAAVYGFNQAFILAAILAGLGLIASFWLPNKKEHL